MLAPMLRALVRGFIFGRLIAAFIIDRTVRADPTEVRFVVLLRESFQNCVQQRRQDEVWTTEAFRLRIVSRLVCCCSIVSLLLNQMNISTKCSVRMLAALI